jgi:hypothetical protein
MTKRSIALFALLPFLAVAPVLAQAPAEPKHQHDMATHHRDMCSDQQAGHAARLAWLETKLELTDAQKPLFAKFKQTVLDNAAKEKAACLAVQPATDAPLTILDHEKQAEAMLSAKLASLQASRAPLQALYESLTPAQRKIVDGAHHGGHGGMMMMMHEHMMHGGMGDNH